MRSRKVTRYWCDHCNKAGLQAHAMAKHEAHCTLNPLRKCRVCELLGEATPVVADLVALLPRPGDYPSLGASLSTMDEVNALCPAVDAAIPTLRDAAHNCPACIMVALRQAGIPVPMVDEFGFKVEMKSIFDDINADRYPYG